MKIVKVQKNLDTGLDEILVQLSNLEVKWVKSAVYKYNGDEYGDTLPEHVRDKFLECKNILNPS